MALSVNLAQINSAARGNSDLRETLTGIHLALQSLYAQTGTTPWPRSMPPRLAFTAPPAASKLSVSGANGSFTVSITAAQSSNNAPVYQEISSATVANFATGVSVYPISATPATCFLTPAQPSTGRLRSSYNQQNWSSYTVQPGAVSLRPDELGRRRNNLSLNQSNYATVGLGGGRQHRHGARLRFRGVGTSWTSILGNGSKVIAAGTILNVAYAASGFVVWDGQKYN